MCLYKNVDNTGYRKWRDEIMDNNIEISLNEQEQTTLEAIKNDIMRDVRAEIAKNNTKKDTWGNNKIWLTYSYEK